MKKIILSSILSVGLFASCASTKELKQGEELLTVAPETRNVPQELYDGKRSKCS